MEDKTGDVCKVCQSPIELRTLKIPWMNGGEPKTFTVCRCGESFGTSVRVMKIEDSGLPPRLIDETMDDWKMTEENGKAYEWWQAYVSDLSGKIKAGRGALLAGPYGTGKSKMASSIFRKVLSIGKYARYINNGEIKYNIQRLQGDGQELSKWIDRYRNTSFLFWDDIGQTAMSELQSSLYYQVINYRYDHKLATLYTTHMNEDELSRTIGGENVSRILGSCDVVRISGPDMRK